VTLSLQTTKSLVLTQEMIDLLLKLLHNKILTENIKNENKTIAVFHMDSENDNMDSQISRDIIGLFLLTSSALVYSRNDLICVKFLYSCSSYG
jgi:hypothetical protein